MIMLETCTNVVIWGAVVVGLAGFMVGLTMGMVVARIRR
jgi:F0F1-type ATP synthase membrane subunit c/vacuolar-type H+-ATPase subunit K